MLEFVLTFLVVFFVFCLLWEFCMWIYCYNVMADAAKAGVRYAIVHGSNVEDVSQSGPETCTDNPCAPECGNNVSAVVDEVTKWADFSVYSRAGMTVTVCYLDGNNKPPNRVQVQITAPVVPYFSRMFSAPPMKASAEGRIVN